MELFLAFKYLHIVAMFFFVAMAISGEVVLRRVASSRDVRTIRTTIGRIRPLTGPVAGGLLVLGLIFGVLAALTGQISLLAPWLILSYVAVAAAMVIGFTVTDPWVSRLERAANGSDDERPSEALEAVIAEPAARFGTWALMALIATLVFLMVVKPFA
jgi:hypothetical protein